MNTRGDINEQDDEDEKPSVMQRVYEIADEIGPQFGMTTAEFAFVIAERIVDEQDRAATVRLAQEGVAMFLRRRASYERQRIEDKVREIATAAISNSQTIKPITAMPVESDAPTPILAVTEPTPIILPYPSQLEMELDYLITPVGQPTIPLRMATAIDVDSALAAISAQRRGIDRTERRLRHFQHVLAGLPRDIPIGELVKRGEIKVEILFADTATGTHG